MRKEAKENGSDKLCTTIEENAAAPTTNSAQK